MIQEAYCSFEVAKLLKEKGFTESCYGRYSIRSKEFHLDATKPCNNGGNYLYCAPTHQMAMAWLREEKYVLIFIIPAKDENSNLTYCADVWTWNDDEGIYEPTWAYANYIYEEAVEAALKYSLENLI